ncbi:MAG: energy transducer TonB [Spirochaetia bacterium]|nr:energy transducer TonB [Spirochaetia bacterium]
MTPYSIALRKISEIINSTGLQAFLYSMLFHLTILLIYTIINSSGDNFTYEFGTDASFNGVQSSGKPHKKLSVSEAPKEIKKAEKSPDGTEKSAETDDQSVSSEDAADIANASDLSFFPNASSPYMVGSLRQYYPQLARQMNVEAAVYVSIVINKNGKVIKVKVTRVVLSKQLPPRLDSDLKIKFGAAITRSLKEVRFSSPMIDGKNVPIEMEQMVRYKLN